MQVAFEREIDYMKGDKGHSHYFWTASKDKLLKYWDGDKVGETRSMRSAFNVDSHNLVREHPKAGRASRSDMGFGC